MNYFIMESNYKVFIENDDDITEFAREILTYVKTGIKEVGKKTAEKLVFKSELKNIPVQLYKPENYNLSNLLSNL